MYQRITYDEDGNVAATTNGAGDITEGADLCNALFFKGIAYANRFAKRIFIRFAP